MSMFFRRSWLRDCGMTGVGGALVVLDGEESETEAGRGFFLAAFRCSFFFAWRSFFSISNLTANENVN